MPFEGGYVPSDGYRHYYHGTYEKMEFEPCGHILEDYLEEDVHHHNKLHYDFMVEIRKQEVDNIGKKKLIGGIEYKLANNLEGITCPLCEEKITEIRHTINRDISEMPESLFKAKRIMGWV